MVAGSSAGAKIHGPRSTWRREVDSCQPRISTGWHFSTLIYLNMALYFYPTCREKQCTFFLVAVSFPIMYSHRFFCNAEVSLMQIHLFVFLLFYLFQRVESLKRPQKLAWTVSPIISLMHILMYVCILIVFNPF